MISYTNFNLLVSSILPIYRKAINQKTHPTVENEKTCR